MIELINLNVILQLLAQTIVQVCIRRCNSLPAWSVVQLNTCLCVLGFFERKNEEPLLCEFKQIEMYPCVFAYW